MTVAKFTQPNYTSQSAAAYKAAIDAAIAVLARTSAAFAPHEQDVGSPTPDMSVRIDAGFVWNGGTLTEVAAQTVSGFTTPTAGTVRVDRIVLNPSTGACSRVAGTAQSVGSPTAVAPSITAGSLPICQIAFTASSAMITNSMITDERVFLLGNVLYLSGGTLSGDLLFTDATYDIGKTGATRPRDGFFSRNVTAGGSAAFAGTQNYVGAAYVSEGAPMLSATNAGSGAGIMSKNSAGANAYAASVWNAGTSGDNLFLAFSTEGTLTLRGGITYNRGGGLVAYGTTSDYRLKDLYGKFTGTGAIIDAVPVYLGKMKGATIERPMFVAHEMQAAAPYAVTGTKDGTRMVDLVDEQGAFTGEQREEPDYQQLDHQILIPLLWAEIQSLRKRVAALEA